MSDKPFVINIQKAHTIGSLIRKYLWETGVDAGYDKGHPYIGGSNLVIRSTEPKKAIQKALVKLRHDLKEFSAEFDKKVK